MKCIKCGKELNIIYGKRINHICLIIGYECLNPDCEEFNKSWDLNNHKDNQDWSVRHIKLLESENLKDKQRITLLEDKLELLMQKLGV